MGGGLGKAWKQGLMKYKVALGFIFIHIHSFEMNKISDKDYKAFKQHSTVKNEWFLRPKISVSLGFIPFYFILCRYVSALSNIAITWWQIINDKITEKP